MASKRKVELDDESELMIISPIGAGNEVGRSCIVLKFKGKTVMVLLAVIAAYKRNCSKNL